MKKVVLYTMNKCPHCQTAKCYLDEQGINYRLCNVQTPKGQKELARIGMRSVPILLIGGEVLQGFSVKRFQEMYR